VIDRLAEREEQRAMEAAGVMTERDAVGAVSYLRTARSRYDLAVLDAFPHQPIVVAKGARLEAAMIARIGHVLGLVQSLIAAHPAWVPEDAAGSATVPQAELEDAAEHQPTGQQ
jgi:hypothetical protein